MAFATFYQLRNTNQTADIAMESEVARRKEKTLIAKHGKKSEVGHIGRRTI